MIHLIVYVMAVFAQPAAAPPPPPPPMAVVVPAPIPPPVATTTTTTLPPAVRGPQAIGPSVTVVQDQCLVTWSTTQTDPVSGQPTAVNGSMDTTCADAPAIATQYPGATVQKVAVQMTTGAP